MRPTFARVVVVPLVLAAMYPSRAEAQETATTIIAAAEVTKSQINDLLATAGAEGRSVARPRALLPARV